ncbi:uncharacterized protein LOC143017814 isoform X2 [Oratosquilla oratoria]|uniref:uncharacterized protein LOC143017814 isoform X2 n=1 Tax=Oratosquilla oratoria TaxID=337810 RepID=UPI003F762B97
MNIPECASVGSGSTLLGGGGRTSVLTGNTSPLPSCAVSPGHTDSSFTTVTSSSHPGPPPYLSSSLAGLTPAVHPGMSSMWGIGGFATPVAPPPPTSISMTIASTLGNPQMPNASYFSRAPMGYHSRMSGLNLALSHAVQKRKPADELEESKPATKQYISEERMAAHLNSLHLSESFHNHRLGKRLKSCSEGRRKGGNIDNEVKEGYYEVDIDNELKEDLKGDRKDPSSPRLILAEEIKHMPAGESPLPLSLIRKLSKPSMEVVLWQPPGSIISNFVAPSVPESSRPSSSSSSKGNNPESLSSSSSSLSTSDASAMPPPPPSSQSQTSSDGGMDVDAGAVASVLAGLPAPSHTAETVTSPSGASSNDFLSLPSTSSGHSGAGVYLPPLGRPASPLPEAMLDDDFSERMEFNNNNGNTPNYMWLEENNNSALIDFNALQPYVPPNPEDLPDLPDYDDMDL